MKTMILLGTVVVLLALVLAPVALSTGRRMSGEIKKVWEDGDDPVETTDSTEAEGESCE